MKRKEGRRGVSGRQVREEERGRLKRARRDCFDSLKNPGKMELGSERCELGRRQPVELCARIHFLLSVFSARHMIDGQ